MEVTINGEQVPITGYKMHGSLSDICSYVTFVMPLDPQDNNISFSEKEFYPIKTEVGQTQNQAIVTCVPKHVIDMIKKVFPNFQKSQGFGQFLGNYGYSDSVSSYNAPLGVQSRYWDMPTMKYFDWLDRVLDLSDSMKGEGSLVHIPLSGVPLQLSITELENNNAYVRFVGENDRAVSSAEFMLNFPNYYDLIKNSLYEDTVEEELYLDNSNVKFSYGITTPIFFQEEAEAVWRRALKREFLIKFHSARLTHFKNVVVDDVFDVGTPVRSTNTDIGYFIWEYDVSGIDGTVSIEFNLASIR